MTSKLSPTEIFNGRKIFLIGGTGFVGKVTLKARYTFEKNSNTNWATDNFTPYSPSAADAGGADITNGGRSLFLAYNNPNYTAQIVSLGLAANW